jgi:hypothetical protein
MNADTVTAICATVIATASFVVSIQQTTMARRHNQHSTKPVLEIWLDRSIGKRTGVSLINHGLGPAFITRSSVRLDGVHLGEWNGDPLAVLRQNLHVPHSFAAVARQPWVIPAGGRRYLLFADDYSDERHGELWHMVSHRLTLEFGYESVYGGEDYVVAHHPEHSQPSPRALPPPRAQPSPPPAL